MTSLLDTARSLRGRLGLRGALALALVLLLAALGAALLHLTAGAPGEERSLDELDALVAGEQVAAATLRLQDSQIAGVTTDGQRFWTAYPTQEGASGPLVEALSETGAVVTVDPQPGKQVTRLLVSGLLPLLVLAALFGLLFAGDSAGAGVRGFGTLRRGRAEPPAVGFDDVAGAGGAVAELREVVDYLREPDRYAAVGAAAPRGVLLVGPPGTGKTLIARATAGEAGVPFFSVSGAEFVESLVGVGAARMRDLFEKVRAVAPAIVFIDEIDAAGRRRGSGESTGSSDEREQTLNQLLVELDGFSGSSGVVVMAATNRPDVLDPALLRPGRFDRHVVVDTPDRAGRLAILSLHAATRSLAGDVDLDVVAGRTTGFSGAELAGLVNEAALLAVRHGRTSLTAADLSLALDRVVHGSGARHSAVTPAARRRLAVRAAGHAVLAHALAREVSRISLLGHTGLLPVEHDADVRTRSDLVDDLALTLAPTAAEQQFLGAASTAGEADLEEASRLARDLVMRYGLDQQVGAIRLVGPHADDFLGGEAAPLPLSEALRARTEDAVSATLAEALDLADRLLAERAALVEDLATRLEASESLEGAELELLLTASREAPAAT